MFLGRQLNILYNAMLSMSKWIGAIFKSSWYQLSQSSVALGHTNWRLNVLLVRKRMHPTLLCDVGRNSFIFVARASLSFILMSWQVWLSLCWDGQLSHTRLHKIAETQLFPQLLSFGIYAGALQRDGLPKKVAVLLDFVQMRGGSALPKFFVQFSKTVYIGSIWGWRGRGTQIFWHIGIIKKSGTSCPN